MTAEARAAKASGARRGIPELFRAELQHGDDPVRIGMAKPQGIKVPAAVVALDLKMVDFGRCPICLASGPLTKEHVPPASIGGTKLTYTCSECNNIFGSRFEPHLADWYHDAIPQVRFSGDVIPGARKAGRILVRQGEDEQIYLLMDAPGPGIRELIEHGDVNLQYIVPTDYELKVAALKTAYLTCCLLLGGIPMTPVAVQVRQELMAARNSNKNSPPPESEVLRRLIVKKSGDDPVPGEVTLIATRLEDDSLAYAFGFNQFWTATWPIDPPTIRARNGAGSWIFGETLPSKDQM